MGKFETVKSQVSAMDAAMFYGVPVQRNKALCIWHSDTHPSLSFKDGYCKCFACGKGGSSIDVVMQLFDLTAVEAADKLCADFGIDGDAANRTDTRQIHRQAQNKMLQERFTQWVEQAHHTLSDYLRILRKAQVTLSPMVQDEAARDLFFESVQDCAAVEYYLEFLEHGTQEEQIEFFKQNRQVVSEYAQRVRKWRDAGFVS